MARQYGRRSSRATRNLRSAGWDAVKFTARTADKATVGLFRWATTDHSGMSKAFDKMPSMGFIDTVRYGSILFLAAMVNALLRGVMVFISIAWIFFLIAYALPIILTGHF